jgi:uncharacterized protein YqgC (DUF456 family)
MTAKFYRQIKIIGLISFIPLLLLAGPLAGYFAGDYLEKRFKWPSFVLLIALLLGLIASFAEIARIIKFCLKEDKDS